MKVALFGLALAVVLGVSVAVGAAIGPEPSAPDAARGHGGDAASRTADSHGAGASSHAEDAMPRGLASAADGLRLVVATPELARGRMQELHFRLLDEHDRAVRAFELGHERRMHAIVVRRDLTRFQHVHPRMAADGTWRTPLRLDAPGSYRLFADFRRDGAPRTLASDLRVDGAADLVPLPAPSSGAVSDGGDTVRLADGLPRVGHETTLRFSVTRDGAAVTLAPYLGAGGHLVALREGDLAFLHVHPVGGDRTDGRVAFAATFPSAGHYRLFLQYRVGGQVRTAAFTLAVRP